MTTLFNNSHDALVFAFNFSSAQYGVSELARMAGPMASSGKGLIGMDGAGQAGMIMREVEELGHPVHGNALRKACIVASYSPKFKECPCCRSDRLPLADYQRAIELLRDASEAWISGSSRRHLREAIIRAYYEPGVSLKKEAERFNIAKSTAYDQKSVIVQQLKKIEEDARVRLFARLDSMFGWEVETCSV